MNSRKVLFTALLIIVAALSVATSSRTVKADAAPTKVVLDMDEYHFTIEGQAAGAPLMFKTGILYALTVKNTGKLNHEIWFGKDPQMGEDSGRLESYTIQFTLPDTLKGKWEVGCFQPMPKATDAATPAANETPIPEVPHYMVGMKGDLIIQ